jgi:hypothetical protein
VWAPPEAPASFIAEWDVQIEADHLLLFFFCAKGLRGESPFDPSLPPRDGNFVQYIKDRLVSYHTSYYSAGRGISNLRKNNEFFLLGTGEAGIPHGSREVHRVAVARDAEAGTIQVDIDGEAVLVGRDDDAERFGPPHAGGWLGFRQMRGAVARYRNLRVHALSA